MSFFSEASLAMIPSGYKTSKVYSALPITGDGDLTFSRSNDTATRVGPDGLIEKVRTNLALYSEQFDNASWTKNAGATITANTTTAPDGTLTADTLNIAATVFSGLYQVFTTSTNSWTNSLFVKKGTKDFIYLFDPTTNKYAWFNLTTGAVGQKTPSTEAAMISVGNGWYRISVTAAVTGNASHYVQFGLSDADGSFTPASTGTAFIWGAQAEVSDFGPTDYIATTTAAVSVGPVANLPRLDYSGGASCPSLLLEPQRTNLFQYSEQLNTGTSGATATPNQAVSPDGYTNADLITGAGANNYIAKSISGAFTGTHTFSIFLKSGTDSAVGLDIYDGTYYNATYNLATGVATGTGASMVSYGNGWYRCILTRTTSANPVEVSISSIGDGLTIYAWGGQFEADSAYGTSYIPTLGAAVTRGADNAVKTGIGSLLSASEYTLYWEGTHIQTGTYNSFMTIYKESDLNSSARFYRNNTDNEIRTAIFDSVSGLSLDLGSGVTTQTAKCALRVKAGDYALYVNGNLVNSSPSALAPSSTMDAVNLQYYVSNQSFDQKTGQVLFFKTALSNADLAALTA
jgi:hypothetical protein